MPGVSLVDMGVTRKLYTLPVAGSVQQSLEGSVSASMISAAAMFTPTWMCINTSVHTAMTMCAGVTHQGAGAGMAPPNVADHLHWHC